MKRFKQGFVQVKKMGERPNWPAGRYLQFWQYQIDTVNNTVLDSGNGKIYFGAEYYISPSVVLSDDNIEKLAVPFLEILAGPASDVGLKAVEAA